MMDGTLNAFWKQKRSDLVMVALYLLGYLFVHAYIMMRVGLNQDEILDFDGSALGSYYAAGRWGFAIYRFVMGEGVYPLTAGLIAGVYLSVAYCLQVHLLRLNTITSRLVYAVMGLGLIQFAYMQVYSHQVDIMGLSLLLSTASVFVLDQQGMSRIKAVTLAAGLLGVAISMYQSVFLYFAVLFGAVYLCKSEDHGKVPVLDLVINVLVTILGGMLVWYVGKVMSLAMGMADTNSLQGMVLYQKSITSSWSHFSDMPIYQKCRYIGHILRELAQSCFGLKYRGEWVYTTSFIPLILLLRRYFLTKHHVVDFLLKAATVFLIWLLPHTMIIYMVNYLGARVAVAEPLACACLWGLFVRPLKLSTRQHVFLLIMLGFVMLKASYNVTRMAWEERINYENQRDELRCMFVLAQNYASAHGLVYGQYDIVLVEENAHTEDTETPPYLRRYMVIHWFARFMNMYGMRGCLPTDLNAEVENELEGLSSWPNPDCVLVRDHKVFLKVDRLGAPRLPYSYCISAVSKDIANGP